MVMWVRLPYSPPSVKATSTEAALGRRSPIHFWSNSSYTAMNDASWA
jgi:hypothetical protein